MCSVPGCAETFDKFSKLAIHVRSHGMKFSIPLLINSPISHSFPSLTLQISHLLYFITPTSCIPVTWKFLKVQNDQQHASRRRQRSTNQPGYDLRNSQYSILIMTSNMKYNRSAIIQEITGTKKFDDKYMKLYMINNYKNGSGSLTTIPGKIGIWKCWFLRREENQNTRWKPFCHHCSLSHFLRNKGTWILTLI